MLLPRSPNCEQSCSRDAHALRSRDFAAPSDDVPRLGEPGDDRRRVARPVVAHRDEGAGSAARRALLSRMARQAGDARATTRSPHTTAPASDSNGLKRASRALASRPTIIILWPDGAHSYPSADGVSSEHWTSATTARLARPTRGLPGGRTPFPLVSALDELADTPSTPSMAASVADRLAVPDCLSNLSAGATSGATGVSAFKRQPAGQRAPRGTRTPNRQIRSRAPDILAIRG
jgi:hypothetical protein